MEGCGVAAALSEPLHEAAGDGGREESVATADRTDGRTVAAGQTSAGVQGSVMDGEALAQAIRPRTFPVGAHARSSTGVGDFHPELFRDVCDGHGGGGAAAWAARTRTFTALRTE